LNKVSIERSERKVPQQAIQERHTWSKTIYQSSKQKFQKGRPGRPISQDRQKPHLENKRNSFLGQVHQYRNQLKQNAKETVKQEQRTERI
jgi:hypothetical protein